MINPWGLFVANNGDIFIDNGYKNGRVDKWILNGTSNELVMHVNSSCTGLFIDIINNLYCSSANAHRVFKLGLEGNTTMPLVVAGTGCPGPIANMLDHPHGIFADEEFNLFVADSHNNRIQLFGSGQLNAITVAGFGALATFILNRPTSVVIDADGYLFIVDSGNHRIIRSVSDKFQCLFGCSGNSGASASQLNNPQAMAFDNDGSILVTDFNNRRIQKFILAQNSCVPALLSVASGTSSNFYSGAGAPDAQIAALVDPQSNAAYFGSGGNAPQYVQLQLSSVCTIYTVRLQVYQTPTGATHHQLFVGPSSNPTQLASDLKAVTYSDQWINITYNPPLTNVRFLRLNTLSSPSWVAWNKFLVYGV